MGKGRKTRIYDIKWRESDEAELKKAVRNFNNKIKRISKKNPEMKNILPDLENWKDIKKKISTRSDFNNEINMLKRFSSNKNSADVFIILQDGRTVKKDVYDKHPENYNVLKHLENKPPMILRWEKNEISRYLGGINEKRAILKKQIEEIEVTYQHHGLGQVKGEVGMGDNLKNALLPLKGLQGNMDRDDVKGKLKSIRLYNKSNFYDIRNQRLKENYIKGLKENYNINEIQDIIDHIDNISEDEFLKVFYAEKNASMEIASPKKKTKHIEKENLYRLRNAWFGDVIPEEYE